MSPWLLMLLVSAVWVEVFARLRYTPPGRHRVGVAPGLSWDIHTGVTEEGLWPATPARSATP
jgi:hypothetical protein